LSGRLESEGSQSADGDRGGSAGKIGSDASDFLVALIGGASADEFVVFEDDDDVRPRIDGRGVKAAGRDELYVNLALGGARWGRSGG
jgi:hypothetical protein